jgi:sirohydrochlorin ferrochelatase
MLSCPERPPPITRRSTQLHQTDRELPHASVKAILLIDHGSRRDEANHMLACMANLVQAMAGAQAIVEYAHMELAEPSIDQGFARCVARGATEVVAFPYMLSPGRHSTSDIPNMVADAARAFPGVAHRVTAAFGVHEKLGALILERAGLAPARSLDGAEAACCWDPAGSTTACGAACRARQSDAPAEAAAAGAVDAPALR